MKTIDLKEFTDNFMEISSNLTNAETRMLYLLITTPDVITLSRQKFAEKIGTNRRTIWLGIEKLKKLKYLSGIDVIDDEITIDSDINITKNQIEQGDIIIDSAKDIIKSSILRYNELLGGFFLYQKHDVLIKLFEEFPDRYPETLLGVRNLLPPDINRLAKKYGFVDELRIIKISNKELSQLKKDKKHEDYGYLALIDKYMANKNKYIRKKIVRQFLIYYPFLVEKFIKMVTPNTTENITELVEIMVKELYGIELSQFIKMEY